MMIRFLTILALGATTPAFAHFNAMGVYGTDNRQDLTAVTDPKVLELAQASGGFFKTWDLADLGDGKITSNGDTLGKTENLCSGERFEEQRVGPYCSGVLVAPDIVATAGHCMKFASLACMGVKFVFGYSIAKPNQEYWKLNPEDVYSCREVIFREENKTEDLTIIRLDRPAKNRTPVQLRQAATATVGTEVMAIGHPSGLPQKVAAGAVVRSVGPDQFVANLDTFEHNSGSPIYNSKTYELEGILVSGDDDYKYQKKGRCYKVNVCAEDGCSGEDAIDVSHVRRVLEQLLK